MEMNKEALMSEKQDKKKLTRDRTSFISNIAYDLVAYCPPDRLADLSATELAKKLNVSLPSISRAFKRDFGIKLSHFIRDAKLKHFNETIRKERSVPIEDVVSQYDYEAVGYFKRIFIQVYGVSPDEFRNLCSVKAKKIKRKEKKLPKRA